MSDINDSTAAASAATPAEGKPTTPVRRNAATQGAPRGAGSRTAKQGRTMLGAEAVVASLEAEGVTTVFGYPGGQAIKLYDALYDFMGVDSYQKLLERGVVEVAPLAYMRGRTLSDSFIILDEAQNTTSEQMKMFLTRLGFHSKVVVTGDITQTDLPYGKKSGLAEAIEILKDIPEIGMVPLTHKDVVRHELVQTIVKAYDAYYHREAEGQRP